MAKISIKRQKINPSVPVTDVKLIDELRAYNPVSNAVIAAGSAVAGVLLLRIAYWTPKARIIKDGEKWVVKSREEWAAESGLSFKQTKDAMAELTKRGLIETVRGKFGGKVAAFVRLSAVGHAALHDTGPQLTSLQPASNVVPFQAPNQPVEKKLTKSEFLAAINSDIRADDED